MTFGDFWPQYLRAHRLPGTRALHYFATVVGAIFSIEAVLHRQPILLVGIGLGYALAIGAHRFIERNRPMISVSVVWGIAADLRMVWLALTGGLARELSGADAFDRTETAGVAWTSRYLRYILILTSGLGLGAALLDLDDVFEPGIGLHYALVQLGAPVVAFAAALLLALGALFHARAAISPSVRLGVTAAVWGGGMSSVEASLWRACTALLMFGAIALCLAELAEHGLTGTLDSLVFSTVTVVITLMPAILVDRAGAADRPAADEDRQLDASGRRFTIAGLTILAGSLAMFCWQVAHWLLDAEWRALSLGDLMRNGAPAPVGHWLSTFPWLLPATPIGLLCGVILVSVGFLVADRSRQRHADRLFRRYLNEIRTGSRLK
jgi:hypothetical protein